MFRTAKSLLVAIATAAVFVPSGYAGTSMTQASVRVSYADLNLSGAAGTQTLHSRLKQASRHVCGALPSPRQIAATARYQACMREAVTRAYAEIDSPAMVAMLSAR